MPIANPRGSIAVVSVAATGALPERATPEDFAVEHFWNIPNTITMLRTLAVPMLLFLPFFQGPVGSQVMAWTFLVAALSDLVDGWYARSYDIETKIGQLLDPLADKLLVSTALVMLLASGRLEWWTAWMIVVIVGREFAVTGLRGMASAGGLVMGAAWQGKLKTTFQNAAIVALLFHYETFGLPAHEIGVGLLFVATCLTAWSGYLYFVAYFGAPPTPESVERGPSQPPETPNLSEAPTVTRPETTLP